MPEPTYLIRITVKRSAAINSHLFNWMRGKKSSTVVVLRQNNQSTWITYFRLSFIFCRFYVTFFDVKRVLKFDLHNITFPWFFSWSFISLESTWNLSMLTWWNFTVLNFVIIICLICSFLNILILLNLEFSILIA